MSIVNNVYYKIMSLQYFYNTAMCNVVTSNVTTNFSAVRKRKREKKVLI